MRILVDVPEQDLKLLDKVTKQEKISRAEFVRTAIANSLAPYRGKMDDSAFGLWRYKGEDGVAYQQRMRAEW